MSRMKLLFVLITGLAFNSALAIPNVDISANPTVGTAPLAVDLSWTSTELDACNLNGSTVPTNGNQTINGLLTTTTYSIACTGGKNYTTVTWEPPTLRTDGTPIPATGPDSLGGFELYYSTNIDTVESATPIVIADKNAKQYIIQGQPNSVYYYKMLAYTVGGTKSAYTNAATNTINYRTANDAVIVTVNQVLVFSTTSTVVYNLVKKANGFIMVPVGTVPLNTPCDINQTANGYYAVPVSAVTFSGTVEPVVVLGVCSNQ